MNSDSLIDEELAELIGAFMGDGFIGIYGSHYHVEFIGNKDLDKDYFQFLSKIITAHFNVKPRVLVREGAIRMTITYKEFHDFFTNLGFRDGIKNNTVFIPASIFKRKLIRMLLEDYSIQTVIYLQINGKFTRRPILG